MAAIAGARCYALMVRNGISTMWAYGAGFTARLPGRKRETHLRTADVLTAAYARGDQGELEELATEKMT